MTIFEICQFLYRFTFSTKPLFCSHLKEFPIPDAKKLLVLWITISLAVICAFLLILVGIWKMDVLRDYRRTYWRSRDDEKQICKSSDMYPPVHLAVPTLFPIDLSTASSTANALPFGRSLNVFAKHA